MTTKQKYLGIFTSIDDVRKEFEVPADVPFPSDDDVIVAAYEYESYEGDAFVLYRGADGQLYEVNGSHCSCNGLEGQWEPEQTSIDAIRMRKGWLSARATALCELAAQVIG